MMGTLQKIVRSARPSAVRKSSSKETTDLTPVYFISHGGPNIMFELNHPAYARLQSIGKEITQEVKPKAVVVFSAHWQGPTGSSKILVNTAKSVDLIYDYYGFPDDFYQVKYPNVGSKEVGERVLHLLQAAGIECEGVTRGLDHGVFAPFICMFNPEKNPLGIPLVQVSLFGGEDPNMHYALGKAVSQLRAEGVAIVCSGMAVHNLRDMRVAMATGALLDYVSPFDKAIEDAVVSVTSGDERREKLAKLLERPDARRAHPTFEHLLPVHIAAGAAGEDGAVKLWTMLEASLSWAEYRFGGI